MPAFRKTSGKDYEYVNQMMRIRGDLIDQLDVFKVVLGANSRHAAINHILQYFFQSGDTGISPAMAAIVQQLAQALPMDKAPDFFVLLTSDLPDEQVARQFVEHLIPLLTFQIFNMRSAMKRNIDEE